MQTHDQLIKKLIKRPGVKAEVERIECEDAVLLDTLLKARHDAGLTQAQVAERMGTQAPAVGAWRDLLPRASIRHPSQRCLSM